jgi:hypothetical protein
MGRFSCIFGDLSDEANLIVLGRNLNEECNPPDAATAPILPTFQHCIQYGLLPFLKPICYLP